tara:strand:+ start:655 stop:1500 length:846 start_codon:yes stop_codon:yes gene_type:complete
MADVKYIVMSSEVVIDSSNDAIVITAGASTETLSIAHGSWYITGAAANNLAYKVAAAIQTHSNITTCTVSGTSFEINDFNQPTCSITFTADAAFQIVVGGAETLDWQLLGFSVTSSTGATPSGDCEIKGLWVSDQAPENEIKGPFTAEISQESALDGSVYTFKRGSIEQAHGFSFNFIAPWKSLIQDENAILTQPANATFESFQALVSDGRGVKVHKASVDIAAIGADGRLFSSQIITDGASWLCGIDWVFDAATCSAFAPNRLSAGLELYSFGVGLRAKV